MPHPVHPELLERVVRIALAGCGSLGTAVAAGLPQLHRSLLAQGHPAGISLTIFDNDTIGHGTGTVIPLRSSDIGEFKSVVTAERLNALWDHEWIGLPQNLTEPDQLETTDVVISCVGTPRARSVVADAIAGAPMVGYWLDVVSHSGGRQFVLGEPLNQRNRSSPQRLPTVLDLVPEVVEGTLEEVEGAGLRDVPEDGTDVFLNLLVANHALRLLDRLLRRGVIRHHAGFIGPAGGVRFHQIQARPLRQP
jgi:PRTRC genetic system ThiF family protein